MRIIKRGRFGSTTRNPQDKEDLPPLSDIYMESVDRYLDYPRTFVWLTLHCSTLPPPFFLQSSTQNDTYQAKPERHPHGHEHGRGEPHLRAHNAWSGNVTGRVHHIPQEKTRNQVSGAALRYRRSGYRDRNSLEPTCRSYTACTTSKYSTWEFGNIFIYVGSDVWCRYTYSYVPTYTTLRLPSYRSE